MVGEKIEKIPESLKHLFKVDFTSFHDYSTKQSYKKKKKKNAD